MIGLIGLLAGLAMAAETPNPTAAPVAAPRRPAQPSTTAVAADRTHGSPGPLAVIEDGPGRWWRDVDGKEMVCFPNTVLKVGDTFYMYGEWCFEEEDSGRNVLKCYSSKDLARWKFENDVLVQKDSHLINRGTVLYNPETKQYVYCYKFRRPMRFAGWKVGDGVLAWATCSSPTGQFKLAGKDPRVGIVAGEVSLFQDTDGKAYAVTDGTFDRKEGKRLNVYELSPDYCSIARRVCDLGTGHEAISIIKYNDKYWAFASGLNDWFYSPTSYRMSENIAGPWTPWQVVQTDPPSTNAFKTQDGALIFEVRGTSGSFHVWTGLRYWDTLPIRPVAAKDSAPPGIRPAFVWLPLQWKDGKPLLKWYSRWNVDAAAGTWTVDPEARGTPPGTSPPAVPPAATQPTSAAPASPEVSSAAGLVPRIAGDWWTVAGNPDLGELTGPNQQPVDFSIWQAADGTWQLWSCIRNTKIGGRTRLFHRWEGKQFTDTDWKPIGIALCADPACGEESVQSPHVIKDGGIYHMFYGDWNHICRATSKDGKTFARVVGGDGKTAMFGEGAGEFTRDPMVLKVGETYYCYYCANPEGGKGAGKGVVFCRTSPDLKTWSESRWVAYGGSAGTGWAKAECPFVTIRDGWYYLFRTQNYPAPTRVYRSNDPMNFGIDDDRFLVGKLPVAAPEIIEHEGQTYIASLLPSLKGIRIAKLEWETVKKPR
jgi:hypothetical protein